MNSNPTWLAYVTATGAVLTPIFVAVLGVIGLKMRAKLDRHFELEKQLREDRIEIYNDMLEPFVILFMSKEAWKIDPKNKNKNGDKNLLAQQTLSSFDYRRKAFKMSLVGSDTVVMAYNNLMQYFFQRGDYSEEDLSSAEIKKVMELVGRFLLEIRRSMGNEATKLDHWQMLEWFIKDIQCFRK